MPLLNPSFKASVALLPSIFVKGDTTAAFYATVAENSSSPLLGVVHDGTRVAPIPEASETHAAHAGETVRIHGEGDTCRIKLGGSVTAFDLLTPTTTGVAITHSSGWYGAQALEDGSSGDLIRCQVKFGYKA